VAIESQAMASLSAADSSVQAASSGVDIAQTDGLQPDDSLRFSRLLLEVLVFEREDSASATWSVEQKQCRAELRRLLMQTRQLLRRSLRLASTSATRKSASSIPLEVPKVESTV
jgi:hypothetical protein